MVELVTIGAGFRKALSGGLRGCFMKISSFLEHGDPTRSLFFLLTAQVCAEAYS